MNKENFVAKTFDGLEDILRTELEELGAENCEVISRGVQFKGDFNLLYTINYYSRLSLRILWEVKRFKFRSNEEFYKAIKGFPAENYLRKNGNLSISASLHNTIFNTPLFASLLAKDAICDRFREQSGERPSVDKENPDVRFHLHVYQHEATLFLDSSGESLHKRGYKIANHTAPINEVMAAGMIKLSGWKADCDLIDFMCGSGTILIEGAMIALNIPAGFYRDRYGFMRWLNFDKAYWEQLKEAADIRNDVLINFYGFDISARYLHMAIDNVDHAGLCDFIRLKKRDFEETSPVRTPAFVILNPPYGERLSIPDLNAFYHSIGDTLKKKYAGCTAWIISSDLDALKSIGLHPTRKITLFNGQLECKFMRFEMYQGRKHEGENDNGRTT
ncbi:MAG: THUMP domain-containing protein [Bacteroidales bacterium]|jgi:putative N6-adenine-specific DNA methylase|nr:THUMP domain-containing protein [Bacteroidales bacterium]